MNSGPDDPPAAAADPGSPVYATDAADAADRACLAASAQGDRAAFERLYRRHHGRLTRFLRRFSQRGDLIDDAINDTMWVVWRQAAQFRGGSKVSTWITGIAWRCMLRALRDAAPLSGQDDLAAADADPDRAAFASGSDPGAARELSDWLASGLRTLPEDQRATLELAYFVGLSCEEIAEVMDCAVGTVKARMFRARVRLRSAMPALAGEGARGAGAA